jgi:hypothetical protein
MNVIAAYTSRPVASTSNGVSPSPIPANHPYFAFFSFFSLSCQARLY